jgi:hypothetical protein
MSDKLQPSQTAQSRANFKPSDYMRGRRPHLFSDSTSVVKGVVSREVLSHHLETLTNQKDETPFEEFARRLAEKFVSPNLRPQTGPAGGGDGKTDSETYPVAAAIAERWFVPTLAAAQERWAFAFSAKKDWRGKVQSDVASIVGTNRGYPQIYFVTNQYVPSKKSAEVQDALMKKHGVPVTILDRTWLLDRIYQDDSLDIATTTLGVGAGAERDTKMLGPKDLDRTAKLDALEKAIGDGTTYNGTPHALAKDCLDAALLARELERPRHEIDGRFQRSIRIARARNLKSAELAATYDWAWTSYFWLDDAAALNAIYDDVEALAIDTDLADEIERLTNLLPVLRAAVSFGLIAAEDAKLEKRSAALLKALDRIRVDISRPNNALHAHALALLLRLTERAQKVGESLDDLWAEFQLVIEESHGLGTFPFDAIADALTEVGEFIPESPAFDSLYEALTDALVERRSEGEAATRNSQRGFQKLEKGLPYEAIRWFGRTVSLLVKQEYEHDLIQALVGSSIAYEEAGLYWASRNYALAAASQEFSAFHRSGSIEEINPAVLSRYFATELRLGRIPQILSAHEIVMIIRNARAKTDEQRAALVNRHSDQSRLIGALLLRTKLVDLKRIKKLPDSLVRLNLELPRMALLFLMDREDTLREEGWVPASETPEGYQEFFEQWFALGEELELPDFPNYALDETVELRSRVLGCAVKVTCANNLTSIGIGEALLSTLEALLATSLNHRVLPHLDRMNLRVMPTETTDLRPQLHFVEEAGDTVGVVTHCARLTYANRDEASTFPEWLQEAVVEVFVRFAVPADLDKWGASVLGDENGFSRALMFSNVPNMLGILFGDKDRLSIEDWIEDSDKSHEITRVVQWCPKTSEDPKASVSGQLTFGEGDPPEEMFDFERMKHTEVQVVSPIDVRKWDAAKWDGTFFMTVPGAPDVPPVLALSFVNREPAKGIFEGWRGRFGLDDAENILRVAIIRGITASNPHAYAVVVGPNMDTISLKSGDMFELVSRINILQPATSQNLNAFLAEYNRHGRFLFAPAHFPTRESTPDPMMELSLAKYHLVVREAWQIGEHDSDLSALQINDPPVIPPDEKDAPVLKALQRIDALHKRRD